MIKIKLSKLIDSINVLKELAGKPVRGRTAYQLGKIIKQVDEEFALFNDARLKLIQQYAAKDENGQYKMDANNQHTFEGENLTKFMKEINSLLDTDVELAASTVKLEDLEELAFTPAQMVQLDAFIEE